MDASKDGATQTSPPSVDEELGSWIGRTWESAAALGADQANHMAVTLDRPPVFVDGHALPPGWHWLYFHDLVEASRLGADGHPARGVTMPPVPLERRMWAAGQLTFHRPILIGERLTRRTVVTDIVPKLGRTGSLYFVMLQHDHLRGSEPVLQERQTIVYKDATTSAPSLRANGGEGPAAHSAQAWLLDATALFRYSALTFNGHRIHYDADYAREVEGYPALVVQGPLLATLLMEAAEQGAPGALATFTYEARSPLFVSQLFDVALRRTDAGAEVWASAPDGRIAMTASATHEETTQ